MRRLSPSQLLLQRALLHRDQALWESWRRQFPIEDAGPLLALAGRRLDTDEHVRGVSRHCWVSNQTVLRRAAAQVSGEVLLVGDALCELRPLRSVTVLARPPFDAEPPLVVARHACPFARWPGADDELWSGSLEGELSGVPCRIPRLEHRLLLCLVATRRVGWMLDCALLLEAGPDPEVFWRQARAWRLSWWCALALRQVQSSLEVPVEQLVARLEGRATLSERLLLLSPLRSYFADVRPGAESLWGLLLYVWRRVRRW